MKKFSPEDLEKLSMDKDLEAYSHPLRAVIIYLLFGLVWIGFSDRVLLLFAGNMEQYHMMQSIKGWLFIVVSSLILYLVLKSEYKKIFKLTSEVSSKNQELVSFAEELVAMEEELKTKLEALYKTTDLLTSQKQFVEEIFESSNTAIMTWNLHGEVVNVNHYYTELLGYTLEEIKGKKWTEFLIPEGERPKLKTLIDELRENHRVNNFENKVVSKDGTELSMLWNDTLVYDSVEDRFFVVSFGTDLTKQHLQEEQILKMAYMDRMTGLKNRMVFENEISSLISEGHPFTLYYLDIDQFKNLNDIHGHLYGDLFLKMFGEALQKEAPYEHIYRWGGDEFLVVEFGIPDETVIKTLHDIVQRNWALREVQFTPTASIGITRFPEDGTVVQKLLMNADLALHKAKINGKGSVEYFRKQFQVELERVATIEKALGKALEEDQLELYFQPIYNLMTGEVGSVEVLLRWFDEQLNITTGEFIAIAEQTGQIVKVDQWVIKNAFKVISEKFGAAPPCRFSINLSAQSFNSDILLHSLTQLRETYDIRPEDIEFEITEYSVLHNLEETRRTMRALKEKGYNISLDDFGTRYSSLNYLGKLPFDRLKIDKSYVDYILTDSVDRVIVDLLVHMSEKIGLKTVAEGIESEAQYRALKEMGCRYGQGFYLAKPMPLEAVLSLLSKRD